METLLKFYYKKIVVIICLVFLFNLAILHNNFFIFKVPGTILLLANILLPSQSVYLNDILLKSLPLNKEFISLKVVRFFRVSILLITLTSLSYFILFRQFQIFEKLNLPMVVITFILSLPIVILSFSPFLVSIILPKSQLAIVLGYVIPLGILSVSYTILSHIVRLEGDLTKYISLIVLALPLYFFGVLSNLQTYNGILEDLNSFLDS